MSPKIPKFQSEKEEAEFWDTHSITDFESELEDAPNVSFVKPEHQVVSMRLDKKVVNALKKLAKQKGLGYSSLLRMWILEKFQNELKTA